MFAQICNEFQNITKFDLLSFFTQYRDFLQNEFSYLDNYYAGKTETIDISIVKNFNNLLLSSHTLIKTFSTFSSKLGSVGYWELLQYCQNLNDTLERITKLPKYHRTSKSPRGYKPFIQVESSVGSYRTMQDVADDIGGLTDIELILNNDLEERDYDIVEMSPVNALVDNSTAIVVTTILEPPVGERVYGKDINRKITFTNNDLQIVKYKENVEQKIEILLGMIKGETPEYPTLGFNAPGQSYNAYSYPELIKDLKYNFSIDDLFDSVEIESIEFKNGDITMTCSIKTKYIYTTTRALKL